MISISKLLMYIDTSIPSHLHYHHFFSFVMRRLGVRFISPAPNRKPLMQESGAFCLFDPQMGRGHEFRLTQTPQEPAALLLDVDQQDRPEGFRYRHW
jgi:hypothetical protein